MNSSTLPEKLKDDCIIEAIFEIRFHTSEQPEIIIGRLSDQTPWKNYSKKRLPAADIPAPIRDADESLKFQPVLELRSDDSMYLVRLGSSVVSFHNVEKYCGWTAFEPALNQVISALFDCVKDVQVSRLGFRYVNAITSSRHFISSANNLNINVDIAGTKLDGPINLNYLFSNDQSHFTMTRIATPQFIQGVLPKDTTVVVDIDVTSPTSYVAKELKVVNDWAKTAHIFEKQAFFKLIPSNILERLVEK